MAETGENQGNTFTQEQLEAVMGERIARERAKFADYDELKRKAQAFDEAEAANASELDKMRKRAEEAESRLAEARAREEHAALVDKIAKANNVPAKYAALLTAQTEEGLEEQAKLIGERFAGAVPSDTGKPAAVDDPDAARKRFARELFGGGSR